jgi:hypothetical protein
VHDRYLDLLEPGLNVCAIPAEMDGDRADAFFRRFLDCCIEGEIGFVTLREAALRGGRQKGSSGICDVEMEPLPGHSFGVAVQKTGGSGVRDP